MKQQHIQIGTDVYQVDTVEQIMECIKSIVIYHQGQLDTMKPWVKNTLATNQQSYINYNMMEAMTTTSDDDFNEISRLEFYFTQEATRMGEKECIQWFEDQFGD